MRYLMGVLLVVSFLLFVGCAREKQFYIHEKEYVVPPPEEAQVELPEIPDEEGSENCGCDSETEGFPLLVTMENPSEALYNEHGDLELREDKIILQGKCERGMIRVEFEAVELGLTGKHLSCPELRKILSEHGYMNSFTIVFRENW